MEDSPKVGLRIKSQEIKITYKTNTSHQKLLDSLILKGNKS